MRFVWFWTFWHWSKEAFEAGALLRSPLHGIGGHWDEWFRHEASSEDRRAIEDAGRTKRDQRQFVAWLARRWVGEAEWRGSRPPVRFVLAQLSNAAPFDRWAAFEKYRAAYGVSGLSAIVLAENSSGEPTDVRTVEALALPADADTAAPAVVAEGFEADAATLATARGAAMSVLAGRGLLLFVALWLAAGRRPYPRWLRALVGLAWVAVAALIVRLLVGPEPGGRLLLYSCVLLALWLTLVALGAGVALAVGLGAWRAGRRWGHELARSQIRLRMNGGLRIQGGSAELPFCLNTLLAVYRARPAAASRSWLWERSLRRLRTDASSWAATGLIANGWRLEAVVLEPKLRAATRHGRIDHVLTPRQREAGRRVVERLAVERRSRGGERPLDVPPTAHVRYGFAAQRPRLRTHRCRTVAQSLMTIGGFGSRAQLATSALAVAVSATMLLALGDLWSILRPPAAPMVVAPSSPSPYQLWVSLDTRHPEAFTVVLESDFWANRRASVVARDGVNASTRAEMHLNRLNRQATREEDSGIVWVERRRRFLTREFLPGARVGRYSLAYITGLGHD